MYAHVATKSVKFSPGYGHENLMTLCALLQVSVCGLHVTTKEGKEGLGGGGGGGEDSNHRNYKFQECL